jgi:chemotaxis signal transduction protein
MTVPRFRSTAAFALRARSKASVVERATFVTFSVGGRRFAAAVESVERVLRGSVSGSGGDATGGAMTTQVHYAGRAVPLVHFAERLGLDARPSASSRVLVLNVANGWLAAVVDAVHEIATVDAASISLAGISPALVADGTEGAIAACAGARGTFHRDGREVLVLDVARALGFRFS